MGRLGKVLSARGDCLSHCSLIAAFCPRGVHPPAINSKVLWRGQGSDHQVFCHQWCAAFFFKACAPALFCSRAGGRRKR